MHRWERFIARLHEPTAHIAARNQHKRFGQFGHRDGEQIRPLVGLPTVLYLHRTGHKWSERSCFLGNILREIADLIEVVDGMRIERFLNVPSPFLWERGTVD